MNEPAQILVREHVDLKAFREEIVPACKPVVLKDLNKDWPAVRAGRESPRALANYLKSFDHGKQIIVMEGPPSIRGRIFYREDMSGFNFERKPGIVGATLERLLAQTGRSQSPDDIHRVGANRRIAFRPLRPRIPCRWWRPNTGRESGSATASSCGRTSTSSRTSPAWWVAGGASRFFRPNRRRTCTWDRSISRLSGVPVSMVSLIEPDLARFPRFAEALRHSQSAELAPGDAIYIPYGWWHHVESLTPFNVLVNYWWNTRRRWAHLRLLLHASLTLRDMPADQREVWRRMFEHFIFTEPEDLDGAPASRTAWHAGPAFRGAHAGDSRHPGERFLAAVIAEPLARVAARNLNMRVE